jgi:hypothetical protein
MALFGYLSRGEALKVHLADQGQTHAAEIDVRLRCIEAAAAVACARWSPGEKLVAEGDVWKSVVAGAEELRQYVIGD